MTGANDGARLGAVVDRGLVAERIAARSAPLQPFERTPRTAPTPATGAALVVDEVDLARVEATRAAAGLPLLPFVVRAALAGRRRGPAHVATAGGVVRDAGALRLRALADALAAADGGEGATFTVLEADAALAARPGAGPVLTVGRVEVRPLARPGPGGEWTLALRPAATLSLSFDPAAVPDGAAWLAGVKAALEQRDWEVEL